MEISPSPDVTTRVFMLFKGVKGDEAMCWRAASAEMAEDDAYRCRGVVGVDAKSLADTSASLFRVVEWGGMEVV